MRERGERWWGTWTVTWLWKAEIMERFAAAHSCALRLLIHRERGREEWKAVWVITRLSGTRPDFHLAAADKTCSHLLQLRQLWVCGEEEDRGDGDCPMRHKHHSPPRANTDHARLPRVADPPLDHRLAPQLQLPPSSIISPRTPSSRQKALGKSSQEKRMAKKRGCKRWRHGFWDLWATGCRDTIYLHFCREKDAWSFL